MVRGRLLVNYHIQKIKQGENTRFKLYLLIQFIHYSAMVLLFLGGLFFIVLALKAIFVES